MDHLKEALKKHLMKHKGMTEGSPEEELHESAAEEKAEDDKDPEMSEQAPDIGGKGDAYASADQKAHMTINPNAKDIPPSADHDSQDMHEKIIQALMSQGGHHGRAPATLSEHVADKARAQHAASKMKGKKYV